MSSDRHPQPRRPVPPGRRFLAACLAAAATAVAGPPDEGTAATSAPGPMPADPRIEPDTGRDRRIWPPDVLFDHRHMRLDVAIPDMAVAEIRGRCTLTCAPIGSAREAIRLDAGPGLTFTSVTVDGRTAEFAREESALTVRLGRAYAPGEAFTLVMEYDGKNPGGRGNGLTFSKDDPDTPETDPMCHAQGQPQSNHLWFPCHDFPNERLSTEVVATVPAGFTAVSNGRLLEVRRGRGDAPVTYHWRQDLDHPAYLVTLVVGKFDVVDVGGAGTARPGLWMPVYGPIGSAEVLERNFRTTPDMVALFEGLFDEPYPWDKFANIICRDFSAGAMENTSAVTWASFAATGSRGMVEGTNAHELAHQWFGDLVGYKSWEHLWLGEGWATFGEALWEEHVDGQAGYQRSVARMAGATRASPHTRARPRDVGMVTNLYDDPDERFYAYDNVYTKGGWLLHALRARLGDEAFWAGVRLYLDRHKFSQAETDDFRRALEETSGQSLERFFEQFASRPGVPRLQVDLAWDDAASKLSVSVEQTQKIDAENTAYAFSLPLLVDYGEGDREWVRIDVDTKSASAEFKLKAKPAKVVVDPTATVPAQHRIRTNLAMLLEQFRTGPTPYARLLAAEALAEHAGARASAALAQAAANPLELDVIRGAAASSLGVHVSRTTDAALAASHRLLNPARTLTRITDR